MYVCVCVCMWGRIAKWIGHQPDNQKVPGLIPIVATLVLLVSLTKKLTHIAPVYPAI